MKIMSLGNGVDSVKNSSCRLVVYQITTIPSQHNFHIKETQFTILYVLHPVSVLLKVGFIEGLNYNGCL